MAADTAERVAMQNGFPYSVAKNVAQVSDPAAMTAPANMGAAYTQAEVQALRDDVAAIRGTILALTNLLQSMGLATS